VHGAKFPIVRQRPCYDMSNKAFNRPMMQHHGTRSGVFTNHHQVFLLRAKAG
jgi:hypothetical protein